MIMKKNILVLSAAFFTSAWLAACNSGNQPFPEPPAATEIKETETTAEVKKTAEFSTGSWDGYTFTSPWLNLTFTFPEDCTISFWGELFIYCLPHLCLIIYTYY